MRLHRFYVGNEIELKHDFWLHDDRILPQWSRVLRYQAGQEVILFNNTHERLFKIVEISDTEAHLQHVTDFERKLPAKDIYLLWSLLKKDKNDWVLQKCTELGVSHFIPILTERTEKTGFDSDRAKKIVIEAAEQCGRSDIPSVREPMLAQTAIDELGNKISLYICEEKSENSELQLAASRSLGVLIGPEGGWSDREKQLFQDKALSHLNIHDFTLRAETAAVAAVTKLVQ
jgi:16S rRNA (uracil1498-N3)-methyltransferase